MPNFDLYSVVDSRDCDCRGGRGSRILSRHYRRTSGWLGFIYSDTNGYSNIRMSIDGYRFSLSGKRLSNFPSRGFSRSSP